MKADICSTLPIKDAVEEEKGLDKIKLHETIPQCSFRRKSALTLTLEAHFASGIQQLRETQELI
jgi:hypothetical protein